MTIAGIYFASPAFLLLLLLLPWLGYYYFKGKTSSALTFSSLQAISRIPPSFKQRLRQLLPVLRLLGLALLIIALARPQSAYGVETVNGQGIDIMLATDLSSSMLMEDFKPNRIEAAKKVAMEFVDHRPHDRIGLVAFASESFTLCPLTVDHNVLKDAIEGASSGILEDGTAIGSGLATAVDRLRSSEAKSKVVILLTDGVNNAGSIDPGTAAEIARKFNVKVYTIGMGAYNSGTMMIPGVGAISATIDDRVLKKIADRTGGIYFRATDNNKLRQIYDEIDKLEKSKIESSRYEQKAEEFYAWALAALLLLSAEFILRYTYLKSITPA
jgi:Ca-activated chloride channel family protein